MFDLDDTLLDFQKAERIAVSKILRDMGMDCTEQVLERYHVLNQAQWKRLELGELTLEQVKTTRYQLLFQELGMDLSPVDATAKYEHYLGMGHYFLEGAPEILETLKEKYHLYLVSNGTPAVQHSRLESAGIEHYFDGIYISQEIGHKKPDASFFAYCFAQHPDMKKQETVIVGDSLTSDILGGKNAGIRTIWYHPKGDGQEVLSHSDVQPDVTVDQLSLLPALLEKM